MVPCFVTGVLCRPGTRGLPARRRAARPGIRALPTSWPAAVQKSGAFRTRVRESGPFPARRPGRPPIPGRAGEKGGDSRTRSSRQARNPAIPGRASRAAPETRRFRDAPRTPCRKPGDSGERTRASPLSPSRTTAAGRTTCSWAPGGRRRRARGLDRVIAPVLARRAWGRTRRPATVLPSFRRGPTSDQPRARRCRAGSAAHPDGRRAGRAASRPGRTSLRARGACWRETTPT